jgi:hypothetical protein
MSAGRWRWVTLHIFWSDNFVCLSPLRAAIERYWFQELGIHNFDQCDQVKVTVQVTSVGLTISVNLNLLGSASLDDTKIVHVWEFDCRYPLKCQSKWVTVGDTIRAYLQPFVPRFSISKQWKLRWYWLQALRLTSDWTRSVKTLICEYVLFLAQSDAQSHVERTMFVTVSRHARQNSRHVPYFDGTGPT